MYSKYYIIIIFIIIFIIIIKFIKSETKYDIFLNCDSHKKYKKFKILEKSYNIIASEIPNFDIAHVKMKRKEHHWRNDVMVEYIKQLNDNREWIESIGDSKKWYNFPLMYYDKPIGFAKEMCPQTIKLLSELGGIHIAGYSLFFPKSETPIHVDPTGPSYDSMGLNLCLTGENSSLYVIANDKFNKYTHTNGKLIIFNSELQHFADNKGAINRVILYIDFSTK